MKLLPLLLAFASPAPVPAARLVSLSPDNFRPLPNVSPALYAFGQVAAVVHSSVTAPVPSAFEFEVSTPAGAATWTVPVSLAVPATLAPGLVAWTLTTPVALAPGVAAGSSLRVCVLSGGLRSNWVSAVIQ